MSSRGQIIVTGASKGIGAAVTQELDTRGYEVASLSRSGRAPAGINYVCDVTDEPTVREVFTQIAERGPIVGLVNNAGVHLGGPIAHQSTEEFETVMRLNSTAVMVCAREAYPYLKASQGMIINMGSFYDRLGVTRNLAYCASKGAVAAMTRCMAVEWARDEIKVINVAPGYIETELNRDFLNGERGRSIMQNRVPVGGRAGRPDEVSRLVGALFVEDIAYLTGTTIYVDGAQSINQ